jgi:acetyl-CoA carboxylase carboxyl transferase subunit beta
MTSDESHSVPADQSTPSALSSSAAALPQAVKAAGGSGASWVKCPACAALVYSKRLRRNLRVCPDCAHHFRLGAAERLDLLLDAGSFEDRSADVESRDILGFSDSKPYPARLAEARRKTGRNEAAVYGPATLGGYPLVVTAMDFGFMGGSMGAAVGEIITRAAEMALDRYVPLLIVSASGGARMQEGCVSLMQMAKTSQALARLDEAGLLCICLNTDPTFGGVTASFAMLGDILIAEPRSLVGFAGPSVIQQTIRQRLPEGFQTAEFLSDHGMLDLVEPRENLRQVIRKILMIHGAVGGALPSTEGRPPVVEWSDLVARPAWDVVSAARDVNRPTSLEYAGYLFDDLLELRGDRLYAENPPIAGGIALLGEKPVVFIGHQKGHTTNEMIRRNFGMPDPEGYRKALRLMRYGAKFGMPVVCLVDTPGAYPGLGAEERGQAIAIAQCIQTMSRLPVPTVAVVTGEGGSGGALALATADRVLMLENSYYSVISPEGCSTILWSDATAAPRAAAALRVTAPDLLRLQVIDAVVAEPKEGASADPAATAANLKTAIVTCLDDLCKLSPAELVETRYRRFRAFGQPDLQPILDPLEERPE